MKTQKQIKLKSGDTLPAGLPVTFDQQSPWLCNVEGDRVYRVRVSSAFKSPSLGRLEEYVNDGVCKSIAGEMTEPDGWDSKGSPSWLLALGMI